MTTEKLYDTIKVWRDAITIEGMTSMAYETNNVLKQEVKAVTTPMRAIRHEK